MRVSKKQPEVKPAKSATAAKTAKTAKTERASVKEVAKPYEAKAPKKSASAKGDGFETTTPRRAGILGDPTPLPSAQTPALGEPAPADASRVWLPSVFVSAAPSGAPLVNLSANGGDGPVHFSATQQVDPDTHELVVVLDAYRKPGEARTNLPQTLDVGIPLPDATHAWKVTVKDPSGRELGKAAFTPPPLPNVTTLSEAAPEGAAKVDPGTVTVEPTPYRAGQLTIKGVNAHGPVKYHAETTVDEASHKLVVKLDAWRAPGTEATDRTEVFVLDVPFAAPKDGQQWTVEVQDTTAESKVLGTASWKQPLELPKLTEASTDPVPADAQKQTIYWPTVTPGEAADPTLQLKGDLNNGPWTLFAQAVPDPATRTITVNVDAWRPAGEESKNVSHGYEVKVPLGVTDDGKSWKVVVMQGDRRIGQEDKFWPPGEPFEAPPEVNPAKDLADGTASIPSREDGTGNLVIWAKEDRTASKDATVKVGLPGGVLCTKDGLYTSRLHVTGKTALESVENQQPFAAEGAKVTSDGFDQVNTLWALNDALARLRSVGVDLDKLQESKLGHGGLTRVLVNGTEEDNAWYSGTENTLTFGTGNDNFHYASDRDVVVHEFSHYTLDHMNPNMWKGEGASIHEGFSDAIAGLINQDPEMVEDVAFFQEGPYDGGWTAKVKQQGCLRNLVNDRKLDRDNTWEECHDRGEVYGGYLWSLRGKLSEIVGDEGKANDLVYGVIAKHGFFYTSGATVKSEDFVGALVQSAREHLNGKLEPEKAKAFEAALVAEAQGRNLVLADWKAPEAVSPLATQVNEQLSTPVATPTEPTPTEPTPPASVLPTALKAVLGYVGRKDVEIVPVVDQRVDRLDKHVFRVCVRDAEGTLLPVEDGHIAVLMDGERVTQVGGGGTRLPKKLDLRPLPAMKDPLGEARKPLESMLQGNAINNAHYREMVLGRVEEALDPKTTRASEVVYEGKRVLKLSTKFGDFLFDPRTDKVLPNRLAFVQ